MENPCQTHVCKKVSRAKKNKFTLQGRAALPCDGLIEPVQSIGNARSK
jgi:hypothetical protein